jgi:hypothetical protein
MLRTSLEKRASGAKSLREIPIYKLSPVGTAENVPERQSWVCRISQNEVSQDSRPGLLSAVPAELNLEPPVLTQTLKPKSSLGLCGTTKSCPDTKPNVVMVKNVGILSISMECIGFHFLLVSLVVSSGKILSPIGVNRIS